MSKVTVIPFTCSVSCNLSAVGDLELSCMYLFPRTLLMYSLLLSNGLSSSTHISISTYCRLSDGDSAQANSCCFWYRPEQCRLHSESNEHWCKINVLEGMGSVHFAGNGVASSALGWLMVSNDINVSVYANHLDVWLLTVGANTRKFMCASSAPGAL